jgi:hypothetical protein
MQGSFRLIRVAFLFCVLIFSCPARAGSIENQVEVVLLAVSYQKTASKNYNIAIVHDENVSDWSLRKVHQAMKKNRSLRRKGFKLKAVRIPMDKPEALKQKLTESKASAVFIMDGCQVDNAKQVVKLTRKLKILSIAGDPEHVDQAGATLGVKKTGRGYKILINHKGRTKEAVLFDTRLLRMADK